MRTKSINPGWAVALCCLICVWGCRDRHGQLLDLIADCLKVDSSVSTLEGISTNGLDPTLLKSELVRYFSAVDIDSINTPVTCFLRLSCGEQTDYVWRRERISGKRFLAADYFHVQSVAVQRDQHDDLTQRIEESFVFFARNNNGVWTTFLVKPFDNALSSSGMSNGDFSCLKRCWMCREMNGKYPYLPLLFMGMDYSDVFGVETTVNHARLLYLSSEGIEMLRLDPSVKKLFLYGRTRTSMIFLQEGLFSKIVKSEMNQHQFPCSQEYAPWLFLSTPKRFNP